MKRLWFIGLLLAGTAHGLDIRVRPRWGDQPLAFDRFACTNDAGQTLSITRLDFLLSEFAVQNESGEWEPLRDQYAFISPRTSRDSFALATSTSNLPSALRFSVGLATGVNTSNPAQWPAGHPLNPVVNGLHWSWQGGYVFFALEGMWNGDQGYSLHLATDRQLARVEAPVSPGRGSAVELDLDLQPLLRAVRLSADDSSTHSRAGDERADLLRTALAGAFRGAASEMANADEIAEAITASSAHPYRLTFSSQFPMPALPRDNPLTEEGVALGARLFADTRLSVNDSKSCASCHEATRAFSDAGKAVSVGADGAAGARNAMPIFNLAWKNSFFWDGRAATLREQARGPIENPAEMHESVSNVVAKLRASGDYPGLTEKSLLLALEQFMLAKVSFDSKFDRAFAGRETLTEEEKRGFELFSTEYDPRRGQLGADCFHCHGGPLFQSQPFANNGLDAEPGDEGRAAVTQRPGDCGKFAVPSLRNVAVTGPYMHDGRFATLEQVVDHYCDGVKRSATLDPNLAKHPDGGVPLSAPDRQAMVAFLRTLTDSRFAAASP